MKYSKFTLCLHSLLNLSLSTEHNEVWGSTLNASASSWGRGTGGVMTYRFLPYLGQESACSSNLNYKDIFFSSEKRCFKLLPTPKDSQEHRTKSDEMYSIQR